MTASDENAYIKQVNAAPTAVLLDPTGTLGHLYDAKTTPHMFIINPQGTLIYNGAIDDKPTADRSDIARGKKLRFRRPGGSPRRQTGDQPHNAPVRLLRKISRLGRSHS